MLHVKPSKFNYVLIFSDVHECVFIQLLSLLDYGAKERATDAKILRYTM